MDKGGQLSSPVETVREYILECLRFQQRQSRPQAIRDAAMRFEEIIRTARIDMKQGHLALTGGTQMHELRVAEPVGAMDDTERGHA